MPQKDFLEGPKGGNPLDDGSRIFGRKNEVRDFLEGPGGGDPFMTVKGLSESLVKAPQGPGLRTAARGASTLPAESACGEKGSPQRM